MEKVQKNLIRTYSFNFGDDALLYRMKQRGRESNPFLIYKETETETEKSIPYEQIPMGKVIKIKAPMRAYKSLAGVFMFLSAVLILFSFIGSGVLCMFCAMGLLYLHMKAPFGYINYMQDDGKTMLSVMEGKDSAIIQEEIKTRWIKVAKEKHAFVDLTRTAAEERSKMQWLKERGAISEAEYKGFLEQIKNAFPTESQASK